MRVPLRWDDVDGLGHVGHVAVLNLLEEGRDAFLAEHGVARDDYVVGRCQVTYVKEIRLDAGTVHVSCAVTRLGTKSIETIEAITAADGTVHVEATFGLVLWDAAARASRPITTEERAALA